jgi:hypothetical protein
MTAMNLDRLIDDEGSAFDAAEQLTEHQLRVARQIVASANTDMKTNLPLETVGAVLQALSTNFAALILARRDFAYRSTTAKGAS